MRAVLLFILTPLVACNKSIDFLTYYGYLDKNALTENITFAVKQFQEYFRLEPTGFLDNDTLALMSTPRCGHKDNILPFSALPNRKWNTSVITWYQYGSNQRPDLIEKAFDVWAKHTNLIFRRDINNPTIMISFSINRQHVFYSRRDTCPFDFDGPGLLLAHAYLPNPGENQTDIHFDSEENWDFTMDLPRYGNISFFLTLVHEIGHTLGLDHSGDDKSIMFPFNRNPTGISSLNEYELSNDDKLAMEFLYGQTTKKFAKIPKNTPTTTTTTTTSTTTIPPSTTVETPPEIVEKRDICELKNQIYTYLIVNKRIFAFYRDFVWITSLDIADRTPEDLTKPRKISHWLRFLPRNFTEISAIYQRPNGEIALFVGNEIFLFRYPSLSLITVHSVNTLAGRQVRKVNSAFATNTGKSYIVTDDWYLIEINECDFTGTFLGMVSSTLYGVPARSHGAFRYINGMIYFTTDSGVLEFNDHKNSVIRTVPDIFEILNISCIRETLLNKLYEVIKYLQ